MRSQLIIKSVIAIFLSLSVNWLGADLVHDPNTAVPSFESPDFSKVTPYQISSVVDGDTITVNGDNNNLIKVRLIGVDTPETVHPSKPVQAYGKEASLFLSNLLKGEKVYLFGDDSGQSTDKYGRSLCYVFRYPDGLFINAEIVRQGYGHTYTLFPFKYLEQFRELETFAREKEKGLWGPSIAKDTQTRQSTNAPLVSSTPVQTIERRAVSTTVYITKTGKKYHSAGCRYLSKSCIPIDLPAAAQRGYTPCSVCNPPTSLAIDQTSPRSPPESEYSKSDSTEHSNPRVAENGSYYGQQSETTGKPKTTYVNGYYRKDGTYVRGHYRSR